MRSFIVLGMIALAAAAPQGYNYNPAAGSAGAASDQLGYNYAPEGASASQQVGLALAPTPAPTPAPVVSKYFYLHSAPEWPVDTSELARNAQPGRKNYRVVIVKAPSENLAQAAKALTAARDEEQTAIYVLHKKTDLAQLKTAFDVAPQEPSKPSVHFIKYKTPEEAALAQQQIQAQYDQLGGTSEVSDEGVAPVTSVVGQASAPAPAAVAPSANYLPASN